MSVISQCFVKLHKTQQLGIALSDGCLALLKPMPIAEHHS